GVRRGTIPVDSAAVWSAFGAATADVVSSFTVAAQLRTPWDLDIIKTTLEGLQKQARDVARAHDIELDDGSEAIRFAALVGYSGQVHAIELPLAWAGGDLEPSFADAVLERFFTWYDERYGRGFSLRSRVVELRELRCMLSARRGAAPEHPVGEV